MLLRSDAPVKVYTDLRAAERDKLIIKFRENYYHQIPVLPRQLDKTKKYGKYNYNPARLVCDCEEYKENSKYYFKRDVRRLCRHLMNDLLKTRTALLLDKLTLALLDSRKKHGPYRLHKIDEELILSYRPVDEWINVLYPDGKGEWKERGYHLIQNRWSRSLTPVREDEVIGAVEEFREVVN